MQKWSTVKKEEPTGGDSSDDEPITKYREQKDEDEWSLSEYDKEKIRQEVARAITASKQMKVSKEALEKKKLKKISRKQLPVKSSKTNTTKVSQIDVVIEKETLDSEDELATEFVGVETDTREVQVKVKKPEGTIDNPISTESAGAAINYRDIKEKEVISISDDELSVQYASLDNCAEYASHRPKVPAETAFGKVLSSGIY